MAADSFSFACRSNSLSLLFSFSFTSTLFYYLYIYKDADNILGMHISVTTTAAAATVLVWSGGAITYQMPFPFRLLHQTDTSYRHVSDFEAIEKAYGIEYSLLSLEMGLWHSTLIHHSLANSIDFTTISIHF